MGVRLIEKHHSWVTAQDEGEQLQYLDKAGANGVQIMLDTVFLIVGGYELVNELVELNVTDATPKVGHEEPLQLSKLRFALLQIYKLVTQDLVMATGGDQSMPPSGWPVLLISYDANATGDPYGGSSCQKVQTSLVEPVGPQETRVGRTEWTDDPELDQATILKLGTDDCRYELVPNTVSLAIPDVSESGNGEYSGWQDSARCQMTALSMQVNQAV